MTYLVLSIRTASQFGVHSLIPISLNLKLSNVELPDGSNITMNRLLVSQTWYSPYIGVGLTNAELTTNSLLILCIKSLII